MRSSTGSPEVEAGSGGVQSYLNHSQASRKLDICQGLLCFLSTPLFSCPFLLHFCDVKHSNTFPIWTKSLLGRILAESRVYCLSKPKRVDLSLPALRCEGQDCNLGSANHMFLCRILNLKEVIKNVQTVCKLLLWSWKEFSGSGLG